MSYKEIELSEEDINELKKKFKEADKNNDGGLEKEEIRKIFENDENKLNELELNELFKIIDTNDDGLIQLEELIVAIKKMFTGEL